VNSSISYAFSFLGHGVLNDSSNPGTLDFIHINRAYADVYSISYFTVFYNRLTKTVPPRSPATLAYGSGIIFLAPVLPAQQNGGKGFC